MRSSLLAVAAATVLTLAACGSDSKSATSSATTEATTDSAADDTAAGDTATSDSITVDTNFSGAGSDDFCVKAKAFDENDPTADLFSSQDPAQLEKDWGTAESLIQDMTDSAPDEIQPDFQILSDSFAKIGELYAKYEWDFAKLQAAAATDPDIEALSNTTESDAASARVDAYLQQVCGITSGG